MDERMRKVGVGIGIGAAAVVGLLVLGALFTVRSVPAGEKAVVVSGVGIGKQFDSGWIIKNPLSSVEYVRYNTQERSYVGQDYGDDSTGCIMAITKDNVEVMIDMTIVYHIEGDHVGSLRVENGQDWREVVIDPVARSVPRDVAARFDVFEIAGSGRARLGICIEENITTELAKKHIVVEQFALRDIRLPSLILTSIEQKKAAEQDVQTAEYRLQEETIAAQVLVVEAEAQAEALAIVQQQLSNGSSDSYLRWLYIQALTDPDSNIEYVIAPEETIVAVTP